MHRLLVAGAVGDAVAHEYLTWSAAQDLPDPEVLLADVEAASFTGMRADRVFVTLQSVHAAVSREHHPRPVGRGGAAVRTGRAAGRAWTPRCRWCAHCFGPGCDPSGAPMPADISVFAPALALAGLLPTAAVMDDRKLTAAKLWLISPPPDGSGRRSTERPRDLPYLSHALYALVTVPAPEVPTMTCDEWWRVYVNEDWLAAASVPDVARELAHVVWHLLSDHTGAGAQPWASTPRPRRRGPPPPTPPSRATLDPDELRPSRLRGAADLSLPPEPVRGGVLRHRCPGCPPRADADRPSRAGTGRRVRQRRRRHPPHPRARTGRRTPAA